MSIKHISENLLRIRKTRGYNIQELANKCGLSRQSYSKIENGKSEPRTSTLINLADILKVDIKDLIADPPEFSSLRFRSNKTFLKKEKNIRQQILYDVNRWLKDYNFLIKELKYKHKPFIQLQIKKPEVIALEVRELLHLARNEPIIDIISLLEKRLKIKFYLTYSDLKSFFGFSVGEEDGGPAIIVNVADKISIERHIFTVAHEFGHLLLHKSSYSQDESEEIKQEEAEANQFAGYLLLPQEAFEKEIEHTRGLNWVDAILHIKRKFKVSYLTVIRRLIDTHYAENNIYSQFAIAIKKRYGISLKGHKEPYPLESGENEPVGLSKVDFIEDRLHTLVREAYEKERITIGRAAEILGISTVEMRELCNGWQVIRK